MIGSQTSRVIRKVDSIYISRQNTSLPEDVLMLAIKLFYTVRTAKNNLKITLNRPAFFICCLLNRRVLMFYRATHVRMRVLFEPDFKQQKTLTAKRSSILRNVCRIDRKKEKRLLALL